MNRRSLIWTAVEQLRQTELPRPVWAAIREPERGWAAELLAAWACRLDCLRRHPKQVSKGLRSLWGFHFGCRQQPRFFIFSSKPQLCVDAFDHTVVAVFETKLSETGSRHCQVGFFTKRKGETGRCLDIRICSEDLVPIIIFMTVVVKQL